MGGKRLRVEALLAGATAPAPPPIFDLVGPDLWDHLPPDLPALLEVLPRADLYLQDEVQIAFHPTPTRVWCPKGRRGQRLIEAPGDTSNAYGFGLVDWRDAGGPTQWGGDGRLSPIRVPPRSTPPTSPTARRAGRPCAGPASKSSVLRAKTRYCAIYC